MATFEDKVFKEIFSKDATQTSAIDVEEVRFDVHAKLNNHEFADLEMQRASHEDFAERVELYADQLSIESKIHFDNQRTETEKEDHPYLMPTTYSVWICNFPVSFCKSYREELGIFSLCRN
ncbi:MAG: Rpn family recombination-promoting nuclease/putative transposase [Fibrobacter sp.]|nr:Rpn family recombination-promoting nuclease/putative transposase [Fibrobacter sp.]